jgi:hypothetical protein
MFCQKEEAEDCVSEFFVSDFFWAWRILPGSGMIFRMRIWNRIRSFWHKKKLAISFWKMVESSVDYIRYIIHLTNFYFLGGLYFEVRIRIWNDLKDLIRIRNNTFRIHNIRGGKNEDQTFLPTVRYPLVKCLYSIWWKVVYGMGVRQENGRGVYIELRA